MDCAEQPSLLVAMTVYDSSMTRIGLGQADKKHSHIHKNTSSLKYERQMGRIWKRGHVQDGIADVKIGLMPSGLHNKNTQVDPSKVIAAEKRGVCARTDSMPAEEQRVRVVDRSIAVKLG